MRPIHDPLATLVYSARAADVETVIVDSEVLVEAGQVLTTDERTLIGQAQTRAMELRSAAGL